MRIQDLTVFFLRPPKSTFWFTALFWLLTFVFVNSAGAFDPFATDTTNQTPTESRTKRITAGINGVVYGRWNQDLRHNNGQENKQEFRSKLLLETFLEKPGNWQLHLSGAAYFDFFLQQDNSAKFQVELWEAYFRKQFKHDDLIVGQQIYRWGRSVPSLWDVITPNNFSEFLFIEPEFSKLPVPMARWIHYAKKLEFELLWLPFYRRARTPPQRSDWGLLAISDLSQAQGNPLAEQLIAQGIDLGLENMPPDNFLHPDAGLRLTPYLKRADLDIYTFVHQEDVPLYEFTNSFRQSLLPDPYDRLRDLSLQEIVIESPIYERKPRYQVRVGNAVGWSIRSVSARFEWAIVHQQPIYRRDLMVTRVPLLQASVAVEDISHPRFIYALSLSNYNFLTTQDLFGVKAGNLVLTGFARWQPSVYPFWFDTRLVWFILQNEVIVSPSFVYEPIANLQLRLGVHVLEGPANGVLSLYHHNDFAYLQVRWGF